MNEYFKSFPLVRYDNNVMINITNRVAILNKIFSNRYAFYPYEVKNGMRADQVAERYYGDPDLVWLVYLSNNIVDPYHQWTMDEDTFNTHVIAKYGSVSEAQSRVAYYRVNWYEDNTSMSVSDFNDLPGNEKKYWEAELDQYNIPIAYVRKEMDHKVVAVDEDGDINNSSIDPSELSYWTPVTMYDIEVEENRNKASIRLLDNRLSTAAIENLKELLNP